MKNLPTASEPDADADAVFCADAVRRLDPDRYILALFHPAKLRRAALALAAWNLELANARVRSGETMIGMIRLKWHHEALEEIVAGRPRRHPVVWELAAAHDAGLIDAARLAGIVDARMRDLDSAPPADMAELETYARATAGALHQALWPDAPAASDAGAAFALVGLARAAPQLEAAGRPPTPKGASLADIVVRGAGLADQALKAGTKPAAAPAILARAYARRAAKAGYDPTTALMAAPDPWRLWRLAAFRLAPF